MKKDLPKAFTLIKDAEFFGRIIKKGTVYLQCEKDKDFYTCITPDASIVPFLNLSFMVVKWNPEYFVELSLNSINICVDIVKKRINKK